MFAGTNFVPRHQMSFERKELSPGRETFSHKLAPVLGIESIRIIAPCQGPGRVWAPTADAWQAAGRTQSLCPEELLDDGVRTDRGWEDGGGRHRKGHRGWDVFTCVDVTSAGPLARGAVGATPPGESSARLAAGMRPKWQAGLPGGNDTRPCSNAVHCITWLLFIYSGVKPGDTAGSSYESFEGLGLALEPASPEPWADSWASCAAPG